MMKFVLLGICIFAFVALMRNKGGAKESGEQPKAIDTTNMVKDPVCETYIEEDTPFRLKYYDRIYYFCSEECMAKFKAEKAAEAGQ